MKIDSITKEYIDSHPHDCSHILIRWWQILYYAAFGAAVIWLLFYHWDYLLVLVNSVFAFAYFCVILFRISCGFLSSAGFGQIDIPTSEAKAIPDDDLPIYTVFVPLYKEANIAGKIVRNLKALDYPHEKLDVKLLLEGDDQATIDAVNAIDLPPQYHVIVVPDALPKTKPKACNHGLKEAIGKYSVIYDAEDRPDPMQLRKVVAAFEKQSEKIACIQAKLNYYNAKQNLLTRWFAIEYSTTFDLYLPGLQVLDVPIPLGGTSNHFRTNVLRELGGWDPFNVTEDCDLGFRIYKRGYKTKMINSTTWEEANSQVWNWVRQRSRWTKGFFQTHLSHMRNPFRTFMELGPRGFVGFILAVGGSSLMMVLNVIYWVIGGAYLGLLIHGISKGLTLKEIILQHGTETIAKPAAMMIEGNPIHAWPLVYYGEGQDHFWSVLSIIFFTITCTLLVANLLFILMHVMACIRRKTWHLIPYALLMPFYWILISIGAWKGFIQLFTNPFYWEKTIHGLDHCPEQMDEDV